MKNEAVRRELKVNYPYMVRIKGEYFPVFVTRVTRKGFNLYFPYFNKIFSSHHLYDFRYGGKSLPNGLSSLHTFLGVETNLFIQNIDFFSWDKEWGNPELAKKGIVRVDVSHDEYLKIKIGDIFQSNNGKDTATYPIGVVMEKMKNNFLDVPHLLVDLWGDDRIWGSKNIQKETKNKEKENVAMVSTFAEFTRNKKEQERPKVYWFSNEELRKKLKPNPLNRVTDSHSTHVKDLEKSIKTRKFLPDYPIVVDIDGVIQKGHHRFCACLNCGSGAYVEVQNEKFTEEKFTEEVFVENKIKKWSTEDIITRYANGNKGDYPKIYDFIKKTGLGTKAALMLLGRMSGLPCGTQYEKIRSGDFSIVDLDAAERDYAYLKRFEPYMEKKEHWKNTYFILAISKMLKSDSVDPERILASVKSNQAKFIVQADVDNNIRLLCEMYNKNLRKERKISYERLVE